MSFELAVWHEPKPITKEYAENVYQALRRGEPGAATAHPGVATFAGLLPEAEQLSPAHALVTVDLERADEVAGEAFALATECELVCYDPQRGLVPPSVKTSLINRELMYGVLLRGHHEHRLQGPASSRFISAIWNSYSKSDTARRPRTITLALRRAT